MNRPNSIQDPAMRTPDFKGDYRKAVMPDEHRAPVRGRTAVWQARLVLLVMINIAQLWILSATVEAALARHYDKLLPLVIALWSLLGDIADDISVVEAGVEARDEERSVKEFVVDFFFLCVLASLRENHGPRLVAKMFTQRR